MSPPCHVPVLMRLPPSTKPWPCPWAHPSPLSRLRGAHWSGVLRSPEPPPDGSSGRALLRLLLGCRMEHVFLLVGLVVGPCAIVQGFGTKEFDDPRSVGKQKPTTYRTTQNRQPPGTKRQTTPRKAGNRQPLRKQIADNLHGKQKTWTKAENRQPP